MKDGVNVEMAFLVALTLTFAFWVVMHFGG